MTKKGRRGTLSESEILADLNGNFAVNPLIKSAVQNQQKVKKAPKWAHYLKPWVAPEWVPKNIPTLPKSKVKETVYKIVINYRL